MTDKQSWKRGESKKNEREFRVPKVVEDWEDELEDDPFDDREFEENFNYLMNLRRSRTKKEKSVRLVASIIGLFTVVSVYALAIYFALGAIGVDSFDYSDALVVSACFMVIRYLDLGLVEQAKKR